MAEAEPDPREALRELVERKYARYLGDEKGRRRTAAALQRMGYRWDDIRCVLNEFNLMQMMRMNKWHIR